MVHVNIYMMRFLLTMSCYHARKNEAVPYTSSEFMYLNNYHTAFLPMHAAKMSACIHKHDDYCMHT